MALSTTQAHVSVEAYGIILAADHSREKISDCSYQLHLTSINIWEELQHVGPQILVHAACPPQLVEDTEAPTSRAFAI